MKKILFLIILLILPIVTSTIFTQDTSFHQDNIIYNFKEGLDVDFDIEHQGIIINNDKLVIIPKGGFLNITIYEWSDEPRISFQSNIPQQIQFLFTRNGEEFFLYDGFTYSKDSYLLQNNKKIDITFTNFNSKDDNEIIIFNESINILQKSWFEKKIFFYEIPTIDITNTETIGGKVINFTNIGLILTILSIIILSIIWRWLS